MKRNEIHEGAALARELPQLDCLLGPVVDTSEHHILKGYSPIEDFRRLDDTREGILGVDRHQRLAQLVTRGVDGNREPKLLGALSQCDDARKNADGRNGDVPCADSQA